jgi:hypothetical protein
LIYSNIFQFNDVIRAVLECGVHGLDGILHAELKSLYFPSFYNPYRKEKGRRQR